MVMAENQLTDPGGYNAYYARLVKVQLGDLQQLVMSLGVADDYLLWLVMVKGFTLPGAAEGIRQQIKEARAIALRIYQDVT